MGIGNDRQVCTTLGAVIYVRNICMKIMIFKSIVWNVGNEDISVDESYVYSEEPQLR